ncbi:uncharacterized protein EAE97_011579 [Botrytis byssoidea]|uniref:HNH nuclease domain-containing protein n=1 Tax=Botrytis byssoidea TaxID=139641 RepID=A0A9P5HU09_9HELO|nr:uncharacterized protein EAE97_011579 [Botrytis byssoidea]KAF7920238.1 hypothetical protein EAE97_011579 [Botrytis byssoidea]
MSFRDRLEECASKLHVGRDESTAFKTAILFLDLMAAHENENLTYRTLEEEGKIFDRTPSSKETEIKKLENYLCTLNSSFPRYWAVKLQLTYLGHKDKCQMVHKQRAFLEGNAKSSDLKVVYNSILDKWLKNWKAIVLELDLITRDGSEKDSCRLAFRIIANNRRPEDVIFTERLKDCYQIRRVSTNQGNIDGSKFAFGDIDIEEVECIATRIWGSEISRQAVHIVPSRISTTEMNLMFVVRRAINPLLGTYDPKNGLILEKQIADAWEACQICIVPCFDEDLMFSTWEFRVMDSNLLKCSHLELGCLFQNIHGCTAKVGSNPRIDCIQFHWFLCLAISKNKNFDQQRIEEELIYGKQAWSAIDSTVRVKRVLISLLSDAVGRDLPLEITNWSAYNNRLSNLPEIQELMSRICDVPDATPRLEGGGSEH